MWWTVVTMTTVGYGDISPTTGIGKALAVLVMLAGIAVFGVLTANLAAWFTSTAEQPQRDDLTAQIAELTTAVERLIEASGAEFACVRRRRRLSVRLNATHRSAGNQVCPRQMDH